MANIFLTSANGVMNLTLKKNTVSIQIQDCLVFKLSRDKVNLQFSNGIQWSSLRVVFQKPRHCVSGIQARIWILATGKVSTIWIPDQSGINIVTEHKNQVWKWKEKGECKWNIERQSYKY